MICVVLAHFVRGLDALSDQQTTDTSNRPFSTICWLCSKQHKSLMLSVYKLPKLSVSVLLYFTLLRNIRGVLDHHSTA